MASTANRPDLALFSYGFRPFFLAAILFAAWVIPLWLLIWQRRVELSGPFLSVDWHVHEMLFGYASAVIAGFLFTAVPNWTGRMPAHGRPLMALTALWLAGRMAVAGLLPMGPFGVAVTDCAFLAAIAAMIAIEIVAGRNWRNLKVVVPVVLLFAANVTFHAEAIASGGADYGRRMGLAVVIFLITLIGGRIIPSFTRNWLAQCRAPRMPMPYGRFDVAAILASAVGLAAWTLFPEDHVTATLLTMAGILHLLRLMRWRGWATWRSPLLAMLHIAYLFVPLGLGATGAAAASLLSAAVGIHLLGIGAIGGMTVAVMMRATRGHTGRSLEAGRWLTLAFASIVAAALVRTILAGHVIGPLDGITLAATLWSAGYLMLAIRLTPWLLLPSPSRKRPSGAPA